MIYYTQTDRDICRARHLRLRGVAGCDFKGNPKETTEIVWANTRARPGHAWTGSTMYQRIQILHVCKIKGPCVDLRWEGRSTAESQCVTLQTFCLTQPTCDLLCTSSSSLQLEHPHAKSWPARGTIQSVSAWIRKYLWGFLVLRRNKKRFSERWARYIYNTYFGVNVDAMIIILGRLIAWNMSHLI